MQAWPHLSRQTPSKALSLSRTPSRHWPEKDRLRPDQKGRLRTNQEGGLCPNLLSSSANPHSRCSPLRFPAPTPPSGQPGGNNLNDSNDVCTKDGHNMALTVLFEPSSLDSQHPPPRGQLEPATATPKVRTCRGTSLLRNSAPLGPFSRTMPKAIWLPWGGGCFLRVRDPCTYSLPSEGKY